MTLERISLLGDLDSADVDTHVMLVWVRKVQGKAEATVQMLLDRGANVNACEPEEFVTPIMAAVEEESEESLRIVSQCHVSSPSLSSCRLCFSMPDLMPVMTCVSSKAELLIKRGARLTTIDVEGYLAVEVAIERLNRKIVSSDRHVEELIEQPVITYHPTGPASCAHDPS